MPDKVYNVLFVCTGNSCRSIMAECILNEIGQGRFRGHSAGSDPTGRVNDSALELLIYLGNDTEGLRSKGLDEFTGPEAPVMDFVFTVCDNADANFPVWPGDTVKVHWGFADPANFEGTASETRAHFAHVYAMINERLERFVSLTESDLGDPDLRRRLEEMAGDDG